MVFSGKVVKKTVAPGSKSEREAVVLVTESSEYVLRRQGGNPFCDEQLNQLVGKQICCQGKQHQNLLIIINWTTVE